MIKPASFRLRRRYAHYLFAIVQSGITAAVASAITSSRLAAEDFTMGIWLSSWLVSWATMVPIVLLAAPVIKRLTFALTGNEE